MSLFGSMMDDFEDDSPIRSHMNRMTNMMNSMYAGPIGIHGLMGPPAIMHMPPRMLQISGMHMMPFGMRPMGGLAPAIMGSMGNIFSHLDNMGQNPNCHSFTSSSIMTMTSGPDGRPQVYQESMSSLTAPGGIKETKKTVSDSRTGTRKMAIGHHIGDRAHILEREQNLHSGDQEERQEFINLEEDEAETFNNEWESRIKRSSGAISASSHRSPNPYGRVQQQDVQLALPSTIPASNRQSRSHLRPVASPRRAIRPAQPSRPSNIITTSRSAESTSTSTSINSSSSKTSDSPQNLTTTSRKRERTPDSEDESLENSSNKRRSTDAAATGSPKQNDK